MISSYQKPVLDPIWWAPVGLTTKTVRTTKTMTPTTTTMTILGIPTPPSFRTHAHTHVARSRILTYMMCSPPGYDGMIWG